MPDPDAVVIGSGPNGLVAANLLVDAGWDVLVLEAQPRVGGAVASDSAVREGWVHDTFSSFYPLAAASPTIAGLGLQQHGLEWVHAPAVVGHPLAEGRWAVLHRDPDDTAASLDDLCPGDGDAWLELCHWWSRISEPLIGALLTPFPPMRHGSALGLRAARAGGLDMVRRMLLPARALGAELFRGEGPRLLLAGNAAHADIPLDSPGSGLMGLLLVMLGQERGFPVPRGGAGKLAEAMAARFEVAGGTVRTSCRVTRIVVEAGRATGVWTDDGEHLRARRCVIADVSAPALYGGLVGWDDLPGRLRRRMARFEWDPATVKVDWALDGQIPWTGAPAAAPGTVHLAPSVAGLAVAGAEVSAGVVPRDGLILLGQMATADPSRAPAGAESVWAYTHVPHEVRQPSTGTGGSPTIEPGAWSSAAAERMADRVQARIEERAPGFGDRVVARRVLGPADLESLDENLVDGALNGGTAALQQQLVFRPVPGLARAETPIKGLYLGSASAHPGGGVHGACGSNAARAALAHARVASWRAPARRRESEGG
ncbi:phytoene desaturase family protein [Humibacillus xanthopallidus]|uniref:Pyridine nucleotide-disulfide oxidoreductase domain-containing protein 2 n=1 Tax=Humibacillus xanthopallidus TaxID=412689 RepID=A0A543HUF4_9MICO|nr:NAD(P)/FAD-dependent oxidoreductase [Humibacillus xanthopallidus]TQM61981.1 phytoene dehydrogenase-like protein [Humibacillus xanthopallidus]